MLRFHRVRARPQLRYRWAWRPSALVAAALSLLPLSGCTPPGSPESTLTTPVPTGSAAGQQARAVEILQGAYDRLEAADKPPLRRQKHPGGEMVCTLGGPDPALSWSEEVILRVDDPQEQTERVRSWLDAQGSQRLDAVNMDPSSLLHRLDGFIVMVNTLSDRRIVISVESPCFDADGNRLSP